MGEQVLITGATGTIGSALVPLLLESSNTSVVALIRGRDDIDVARRASDLCAYWGLMPDDERRQRFRAVRGDVSQPGLGLAPNALAELVATVSHVIHSAANVKLNMTMDEARASTVAPTRAIIALARDARRQGQLQKLDLVSTVGVWGRSPGVMPETRLLHERAFHNTYEAAKAESEGVVWAEAAELPTTVHRPSMVVGETATGRIIQFQVFYHLCEFLSGRRTWGIMPQLGEQRLDTVPVDWVARAIRWSMRSESATGRILHLCSGPQASIRLRDLQSVVRDRWRVRGRRVPPLRTFSTGVLERAIPLIGLVGGKRARRALRALPPILAYLAEEQAFGNTETLALLAGAGMPLPPVAGYLDVVLDHYLQTSRVLSDE